MTPKNLSRSPSERRKRRVRTRTKRLLLLLLHNLVTLMVYVALAVASGYGAIQIAPGALPAGWSAVLLYVGTWITCGFLWGLSLFLLVRCFYRFHGRKLWTRPRTQRTSPSK